MRNFKPAAGSGPALFEPSSGTRELRVLVDEAPSRLGAADGRIADLLAGLVRAPGVESWRYDARPLENGASDWRVDPSLTREGWVEVAVAAPDSYSTHDVYYRRGSSVTLAAIGGDVARGRLAVSEPTYAHLPPLEAASYRDADAVALGAADAVGADLLVTERPFLLGGHWFPSLQPMPCTPAEGVALVSQFLRLRGTYPADATAEHGITTRFNRGLFFWVGTRALLPEGWRWFSHCVQYESGEPLMDLVVLAGSVFQRLRRSLMARDALRWELTLRQGNDVADDALAEVDSILVDLVGTFDAAARVAHRVLNLQSSEYGAAWQKGSWLDRVAPDAPALAEVMAPGGEAADLFEVMRLMRNTVHGAGLQPLGLGGSMGKRQGTAVSLPIGETARLRELLETRGWAETWGLTKFYEGRFHVSPAALTEHLLRATIPLLNELMRLTPVERLLERVAGDSKAEPLDTRPPTDGPWAHANGVLLQLGFDTPDRL